MKHHLALLFILFQSCISFGQETPDAFLWNEEIIDIKTLSPTDSASNLVWDIDALIDAPMSYESLGVDTLEFERWRLNYRITIEDKIVDNTIVGYNIHAATSPKPKAGWKYSPEEALALGDKMHIIVDENKLIVAAFSPIASGCDLVCINLQTGKEIWHADVQQLMVEHSKYLNEVYLDKIGNRIVLVGKEMGGSYVQVFDIETGKSLFPAFPPQ